MTNTMKAKCVAMRNEAISLGFTREQFDRMTKAARAWPDNFGSWYAAAVTVRNTCAYWGSVQAMKASGCLLAREL